MKIETIKEGRSNSILNKGYNSTNKVSNIFKIELVSFNRKFK